MKSKREPLTNDRLQELSKEELIVLFKEAHEGMVQFGKKAYDLKCCGNCKYWSILESEICFGKCSLHKNIAPDSIRFCKDWESDECTREKRYIEIGKNENENLEEV